MRTTQSRAAYLGSRNNSATCSRASRPGEAGEPTRFPPPPLVADVVIFARDAVESVLRSVPATIHDDVYFAALWLESLEDEPRTSTATISWDTTTHLSAQRASAAPLGRARWNYWF
jgi:hypothetical protein